MRLILILLLLMVMAGGALFGALNGRPVLLDLYFAKVGIPLGVALLTPLAAGWLLGGRVQWFGQVPRLRRDLRALERASSSGQGVEA